ncbi:amidohydrolase family protein [Sporolactobacillus sp. THM19-2]|uniref:amidohydrolase family protein n=1 Tax=Sporolactobacillus sp. THM19-2 TaxID=2511171 RepID=UPI00197F87D3|nr:amidohydrolase family protein [Sporolactobacillus sp. THM19-2]
MLDLLVKNALLVTSDHVLSGSVAVKNGKIAEILPADTDREAKTIIDGRGFYLFPGLIDSHVHLNDPGFEWREDFNHATEAAAVGGVTTVVDMPLQNDPALTNREIFQKKLRAVKDKSIIDYAFWAGVINDNLKELAELNECGVMAFKSFLAPVSSDFTSLDYGRVRKGLSIIKGFDGLAGFHCEDYGIVSYNEENSIRNGHVSRKDYLNARLVIAELVVVQTIIELARESGARVHICHVSHPR